MPWLKVSDTAAFHPIVTGPLTEQVRPEDHLDQADLVNLAFGLVLRCATHSAGFLTDYVVTDGVVALMGGPHWVQRAELAERAGYWRRVAGGWAILDDPEAFVHIRLKDELAWERQRRKDNGDPALIVPVRLRDGDGCRYCGVVVNWRDRKGGRGGTYDHRTPGQPATGPDDLRVACQSCNGFRSDHPDADQRRPPRPAPTQPFYGTETVALLAKHGVTVPLTAARPGHQPNPAPTTTGDPVPDRTTPRPAARPGTRPAPAPTTATPPPAGPRDRTTSTPRDPATRRAPRPPRPGPRPDPAPRDPASGRTPRPAPPTQDQQRRSADPADHRHAGSGSPGRDGTGRESPTSTRTDPQRRRRGRRGRPHPPPDPPPQPPPGKTRHG